MKNKINIILIRHFETFNSSNNNERIIYDNAFKNSTYFIKFILEYLNSNKNIIKIKFITSPRDRTIMTSLIISSNLKTILFQTKRENIKIYDPLIDNILDRDPQKENKNKILKYFKNNDYYKNNTLYIFTSHSSTIYNIFQSIINICSNNEEKILKEKIHRNSLSYITKTNLLNYKYNIKMIK